MKLLFHLFAVLLFVTSTQADPLRKEQVGADVKWLVHLDVDSFFGSKVGQFVMQEFVEKKLAKQKDDLNKKFGLNLDWHQIHGVTAYGSEYKMRGEPSGVLIVHSDLAVADMIEAIMAVLDARGEGNPLKKIETKPFPIYSVKDQLFGTPMKGGLLVLSRSKDDLQAACKTILGSSANLRSVKTFSALPETPKGFIVMGVAEGFTDAPLPPQAKILKNADGAQIVAGEQGDKLFLQLSLSAKDPESATQIQQVLQGLLALGALAQGENKDLQELTQATKISGSEKVVTARIELPVATVLDRASAQEKKTKEHKQRASKRKKAKEAPDSGDDAPEIAK
ncbi:MAG TPA: hypothetical protein VMZ27_09360 [Candidatus Saccharimonadales bacterium]|nr:hypothetical protein [Candidatus Saccharimonadales bacterium]